MIETVRDRLVARITLRRPEARNALAMHGWAALADTAAELARSDAQLVLLSGAEGAFCAGADLGEFPLLQADPAERVRFRTEMRRGIEAVAALPMATVARIEGPCFGAGVALALACDLRVAAKDARFAITPAKMGIGYPQEDVARLVALVGPGQTARLLFTGAPIDAEAAERIGLVEAVADQAGFADLIQTLLACDPGSIAMLKRGMALAVRGVRSDEAQERRFDDLFGSEAVAERLSRRVAGRGLPPATR